MQGNMLIAHGGGPTPVINASLYGALIAAKDAAQIGNIYAAHYGIEGVFAEDFIDLRAQSDEDIALLPYTPASAVGSCRRKLKSDDYPVLLEKFKKYGIRYFFYNGGNDSMDTCNKIAGLAKSSGYDMKVIGIPKTIDNDLCRTNHCPGYGSSARYYAVTAAELKQDVMSLPIHVVVMEVMGRNAGWLTAATAFAEPDLIYLPEVAFDKEAFLSDIKRLWNTKKGILVCASEGIRYADGKMVADSGIVDGFGHTVPGGAAQSLADMIMTETGIKARGEKPGLIGRTSVALQTERDRNEAIAAGRFAVESALQGKTGFMVSIAADGSLSLVPLGDVANAERKFPLEWIVNGNRISDAFKAYAAPLVGEMPKFSKLEGRT